MNSINIIISTYGQGIAVGLEGIKEQIELAFNRFFNWGAAGSGASIERAGGDSEISIGDVGDSYLHFISDNFAYFLSTPEAMIHAMSYEIMSKWQDSPTSSLYKQKNRNEKKLSGEIFKEHAIAAAEDEYNSFKRENFMLYDKTPHHVYSQLDGGAPSWVSETED